MECGDGKLSTHKKRTAESSQKKKKLDGRAKENMEWEKKKSNVRDCTQLWQMRLGKAAS